MRKGEVPSYDIALISVFFFEDSISVIFDDFNWILYRRQLNKEYVVKGLSFFGQGTVKKAK